jgi:hypothetical protein
MECHKCEHRAAVSAGRFARARFQRTPCATCELKEDSSRTMQVDLERPVFLPGLECGQEATCEMDPFPEELEAERDEVSLPLDVMEELVYRLLMLPEKLRNVVCWRFMGLTYPEIAEKQATTTAGAEARHRRAMKMFPELRQLFAMKVAKQKMRKAGKSEA